MQRSAPTLLGFVSLLSLTISEVVLRPGAFLKLPSRTGTIAFNAGTANKAAYDPQSNLLYVVGHDADVLNVISMKDDMTNPVLARTIQFDALNQGMPNDIKVCRGGTRALEFLAISFESKDLTERGHVHFYQLLDQPGDAFIRLKNVITVEGFDPRSMAWNSVCTELIVTSPGAVHTINNMFEDPKPSVDVLIPKIGLNVDRRSIPFSEDNIKSSGVRYVFSRCDSGTYTAATSHIQDLEPVHVTVDSDNTAYLFFQSNNAIGKMDLNNPFSPTTYHNLGRKDWTNYQMDTSYEDNGIQQHSHHFVSLYQPSHGVTFKLGNKTWIATADTGAVRQYNVRIGNTVLCTFDESADGSRWRQANAFSSLVAAPTATELLTNMSSGSSTARMAFSRLRSILDGYNPLQMGYNYLTTYGGRGWSLIDASSMQRVYDSGDILESHFMSPDISDRERAIYNGLYSNPNEAQSQSMDRSSTIFGPKPTAITTGNINGTQVVVVANGNVGGLYHFSVSYNSSAEVTFEGFQRRGSPGLTWTEAYNRVDDSVGEPGVTDLLWIDDDGYHIVVAISSIAGVASFYTVEVTS